MGIIINYYWGHLRWSYTTMGKYLTSAMYLLGFGGSGSQAHKATCYNPTSSASHYLNTSCKRNLHAIWILINLQYHLACSLASQHLYFSSSPGNPSTLVFPTLKSSPFWTVSKRRTPFHSISWSLFSSCMNNFMNP